jgi:hypothetical protein
VQKQEFGVGGSYEARDVVVKEFVYAF